MPIATPEVYAEMLDRAKQDRFAQVGKRGHVNGPDLVTGIAISALIVADQDVAAVCAPAEILGLTPWGVEYDLFAGPGAADDQRGTRFNPAFQPRVERSVRRGITNERAGHAARRNQRHWPTLVQRIDDVGRIGPSDQG